MTARNDERPFGVPAARSRTPLIFWIVVFVAWFLFLLVLTVWDVFDA
jgi:hypothetical protein